MRRTLFLAVPLAMLGLTMAGCSTEPTAGEATPEQLEIVKKNEASDTPPSPLSKKIKADGAAGSFGAQ